MSSPCLPGLVCCGLVVFVSAPGALAQSEPPRASDDTSTHAIPSTPSPATAAAESEPPQDDLARVPAPDPRTDGASPLEPLVRFQLENGLSVVLQRDARVSRVALSIGYRVGSADEPDGYRGLAHLVEHLMFEGMTTAVGAEYFDMLERVGATGINGITGADRTYYVQELPSASLELGLWLEASRMAYLLSWVTPEILERARAAVLNEWELKVSGAGYHVLAVHEAAALYPLGHPYRVPNDQPDDLEQITLSDAQWFFQRWYGPDNATLAVVGNFDVESTRRHIERLFGGVRRSGAAPRRVRPAHVVLSGQHELEIEWPIRNQRESITWTVPTGEGLMIDADDPALDVLCTHLEHVIAEVGDLHHVESVSAEYVERELGGTVRIAWSLPEEEDHEPMLAKVERELARVRDELLTERELSRAREPWRRSFVFGRESLSSRANGLLMHAETYDERAARYAKVDAQAVRAAARRWLDPARRLHVYASFDRAASSEGDVSGRAVVPAGASSR